MGATMRNNDSPASSELSSGKDILEVASFAAFLDSLDEVGHEAAYDYFYEGRMGMTDAEYCPSCGEVLFNENREFHDDWMLNAYRTKFRCPHCGFSGEVIRHSHSEDRGE